MIPRHTVKRDCAVASEGLSEWITAGTDPEHRGDQALPLEAVVGEPSLVVDPLLVYILHK